MGKLQNPNDIVGKRFGSLIVEKYGGIKENRQGHRMSFYICKCECGSTCEIWRRSLVTGRTKTCGHCHDPELIREGTHWKYICPSGRSFIFDDCDLGLVKSYNWWIHTSDGYACCWIDGKNVRLSHLMFDLKPGEFIDHINGIRTDNLRSNLRISTRKENNRNICIRSDNQTGYKGLYYQRKNKRYVARIEHDGIKTSLGCYDTPEEAARAYDEAARLYFGEFACVNFPRPGEQGCRRNQPEAEQERKLA